MRRLKNIAEHLDAILWNRDQEKTLNLQSLEERVLYSAVPLPVDLADAIVNSPEPVDVSDVVFDAVEANVTATFDQLDTLIADETTPELYPVVASETPLLPIADTDPGGDSGSENLEEVSHRTIDTPVAATKVVAAVSTSVGSQSQINEGDYLEVSGESLKAGGVAGETIVLSAATPGGTLLQNGQEVTIGQQIDIAALDSGNVLFIPDLNFTGSVVLDFESASAIPEQYALTITIAGVADDGVAVLGDDFVPIGPGVDLSAAGTESQVTVLEDGSYVIVWKTLDPTPADVAVMGQRFNAEGVPMGNSFQLTTLAKETIRPDIASLTDGGFVVVWQEDTGAIADIYIQRYDQAGNAVEPDGVTAAGNTVGDRITRFSVEHSDPSVVGTADGGFAVVYRSVDGKSDLQMQLFDADGTTTGEILVSGTEGARVERAPEIILLEDGKLVVAWVEGTNRGVLKATITDPAGNQHIPAFDIGTVHKDSDISLVATNGGFATLWQTPISRGVSQVMLASFDGDGKLMVDDTAVQSREVTSLSDLMGNGEIVALADGTFVVGLHGVFVDGDGHDIQYVRLDENFAPISSGAVHAHTDLVGEQKNVALAILNNGRIVSVYESDGGVATQQGVMATTTDGTAFAKLNISPVIDPLAVGVADAAAHETVVSVVLNGLASGTEVFENGTYRQTSDGVTPIIITGYNYDEISLRAPVNFTGVLTGTLSVATNHEGFSKEAVSDFHVFVPTARTAPTLKPIPTQTVFEGQTISLNVLTLGMADDADSPLSDLRPVIVGGADAGLFTYDPLKKEIRLVAGYELPTAAPVNLLVDVAVSDGTNVSNTETIVVRVTNVNDAPTLSPIPMQFVDEGQTVSIDVLTLGMVDDVDSPLSDLSVAIVGGANANWFNVNPATNQLEMIDGYIVPDGQDTDLEVIVVVDDRADPADGSDDALHRSDPQTVMVRVMNVNDAPVWTESPISAEVGPDETFVGTFQATDRDNDTITYHLVDGPVTDEGVEIFEIDLTSGVLRFSKVPVFGFVGDLGVDPFLVQVAARDTSNATTSKAKIEVNIRDFVLPLMDSPPAGGGNNDDDNSGGDEILGIDVTTLPAVNSQIGSNTEVQTNSQSAFVSTNGNSSGVDDFNYSGDSFGDAQMSSVVDLGFYESYYQAVEFSESIELVSQQLADRYKTRRFVDDTTKDTALTSLFWQDLDSSNEEYLRRNFNVDTTTIVAASAGLFSAGILLAVYGGSVAITTLATQIPAWKTLDISPLISAFDEDEESIHQIVDG